MAKCTALTVSAVKGLTRFVNNCDALDWRKNHNVNAGGIVNAAEVSGQFDVT